MPAVAPLAYFLIYLGLVASGDIFLVGVIYSSRLGVLSLPVIFILALLASMTSDLMWYLLGRLLSIDRLRKLPMLRSNPALVARLSELFEKNSVKLLFACKFLYGTRVITQILCGTHRMKYPKYFLVNVAGIVLWIGFLMILITAIDTSVTGLKSTLTRIEISVTAVVGFLLLARFLIRKFLREKWIGK